MREIIRGLRWGVLLLLLLTASCAQRASGPRVLLVGIDGGDWAIIDPLLASGRMPHLKSVLDRGVRAPLRSMLPMISPVIWTTIATGVGPDRHGVVDFTVPDPTTGDPMVITSQHRQAKAFWDILTAAKRSVGVVGWWASWPAEAVDGAIVSDRLFAHPFLPGEEPQKDVTFPAALESRLEPLFLAPRDVPFETASRFMKIDPSAYDPSKPIDFADPISHFRQIYASMTNVARVGLDLMKHEKPELLAVYFEGTDTAGHMYMRYAPPAYPHTTEAERAAYGQTVNEIYSYWDELLGKLVEAAGPEATVMIVSDHGFLSGEGRPIEKKSSVDYATAAEWHRLEGIFAMAGPTTKRGVILDGAKVFDIFPTLLALFDLPVPKDGLGKVIDAAFVTPPAAKSIESYQDQAWTDARRSSLQQASAVDAEMMEKLRSLGYIGGGETGASVSLRGRLALSEYYMYMRQWTKAAAELQSLTKDAPDFVDGHYQLGLVALSVKDNERAEASFRRTLELDPNRVPAMQNLASVLRLTNRRGEAIELMRHASEVDSFSIAPVVNLAMLLREEGRPSEAIAPLERALAGHPTDHSLLIQHALALHQVGRYPDAATAWRAVLEQTPGDALAKSYLTQAEAGKPPTP